MRLEENRRKQSPLWRLGRREITRSSAKTQIELSAHKFVSSLIPVLILSFGAHKS